MEFLKQEKHIGGKALCSVLMAMGMSMSFPGGKKQLAFTGVEGLAKLLDQSMVRNQGVVFLLAAASFLLLCYCGRMQKQSLPVRILNCVLAFLFALAQIFGEVFEQYASWKPLFGSGACLIRFVIAQAGLMLVAYYGLTALQHLTEHWDLIPQDGEKLPLKKVLKTAGILFACWLPYFVIFYPGTNNSDTSFQIMQVFHRRFWVQAFSTVQADDIFMTNHYPVLTSYLYGAFGKLGVAIGNIRLGYAIYIVLQMCLMAFVLAATLAFLYRKGMREKSYRLALIYFAVFPEFPFYAICMLKDVLYVLCLLILMLMLWEVADTKGAALSSLKFGVGLFVVSALTILIRNNGVYFIAAIFVCSLPFYAKHWKSLILTMMIPILLYHFLWMGVLMPAWKVAPGGRQEGIGFAMQMTARYVKDYGDEVTPEEQEVISKVLPYDRLVELYDPDITDPVKYSFFQAATDEELSDYLKLWVKMFFKHPDSYIQSSFSIAYKTFDLGKQTNLFYYIWVNEMDETDELYTTNVFVNDNAKSYMKKVFDAIWHIPLIGTLFNLAMYAWLSVLAAARLIRKKKLRYTIILFPMLLTEAMMFLAPVVSGRYMMPMVFCAVPTLWLMRSRGAFETEEKDGKTIEQNVKKEEQVVNA